MLIDTHLHLDRPEFAGEVDAVLDRAREAGVAGLLNVGYDPGSSAASVELARTRPGIRASVGVHPHDALLVADDEGRIGPEGEAVLAGLDDLATAPETVAWGEIGLDFYRDLSPRPAQRAAFAVQLARADRHGLPVILHIRDAYPEALAALEAAGLPARRGVFHSFAGDVETARWAVAHGFVLGIGGPVTYKNSRLPEAVAAVGLDDLILETDAPWLPPVPHRGRRNEPAYVALTAAKVAEIHGVDAAEVAARTAAAARRVFGAEAWT